MRAGEDESAGAPSWMIWAHRWAVGQSGRGTTGPAFNKFGGVKVGASDFWIRDYTTEPENGGLGVFAHEYAHDLGLPDLYDTSGGENGTGFWTLMSSGSWLGHGDGAIGTTPNHMGAWEKLQLGWLDHTTVKAGTTATVNLGPAAHATKRAQALLVELPKDAAGKSRFYIAENRQYLGLDTTLQQGPYNFGWATSAPDKVEHFPYQNGLLVSYWNTAADQQQHPDAPRRGPGPAGRRPPDGHEVVRRRRHPQPHPDLRRHLRHRGDGRDQPAPRDRCRHDHRDRAVLAGRAGVRRHRPEPLLRRRRSRRRASRSPARARRSSVVQSNSQGMMTVQVS